MGGQDMHRVKFYDPAHKGKDAKKTALDFQKNVPVTHLAAYPGNVTDDSPNAVDAAQLYKGDYVTTPQDVYHGDMDAFEVADKERADEEAKWMAQYPAADQLAETGSE
ncbi:MAG: hypothetical protein Q9212_002524 [Teloschistes hypoglaucus]